MQTAGPVSSTQFVQYRLTIVSVIDSLLSLRWFLPILKYSGDIFAPWGFSVVRSFLSSAITICYISVEWEARSREGKMLKDQLKSSRQYPSSGRGNKDVSPGIALRVMWVTDAHETWYRRGALIWSLKTKGNWGSRDEMLVPEKEPQRRGLPGSQHHLSPMGRGTPKDSDSI